MYKIMNNKGFTLPIVVIVLFIMIILGFSTLYITSSQTKFNVIDTNIKKAIEYAEAGYNKYLWHLNDNLNFYSTDIHNEMMNKPIEFEDGYFMLDVTKPSDFERYITIKSTGWTKNNPNIKKTILTKIRKKQFVHHVYVSNSDGPNIWWTSGDQSHGPYHTNGTFRAQEGDKVNGVTYPIFYDTVSYYYEKGKTKIDDKIKSSNKNKAYLLGEPIKEEELGFPDSNKNLKNWAEKDGMVFYGRTCIFIEGDKVKIRNQNSNEIKTYSISKDISNLVIYVDKVPDEDKSIKGGTGKFGIRSGNIFISGELKGRLTIGAEDNIYITYSDPTNWYDYNPDDIYIKDTKPKQPPSSFTWGGKDNQTYPESGGIKYEDTSFNGNKNGIGTEMSSYDNEKKIYTRYSFDKNDKNKPGKDMLGLIANNDIIILHYGWPKKAYKDDCSDNFWNFEWDKWIDEGKNVNKYLSIGTYYNIKINGTFYPTARVANSGRNTLRPGNYNVWEPNEKWGTLIKEYDVAPHTINIHAAIFSVKEGFGYEESSIGSKKGDIVLWGNITQKTRKAVGLVSGIGYKKKYAHDPRMFYDYPPHILEPTNVGWEIHEWKEISDHVVEKP